MVAVTSFKYLVRILLSIDDDFPVVERNLRQAQEKWGRVVNILGVEGADKRTEGKLYVAVVQGLLFFRLDMWVVTPFLEKSLTGFHHRAVWRMVGMGPKLQLKGKWIYLPIRVALETVGIEEIGV